MNKSACACLSVTGADARRAGGTLEGTSVVLVTPRCRAFAKVINRAIGNFMYNTGEQSSRMVTCTAGSVLKFTRGAACADAAALDAVQLVNTVVGCTPHCLRAT